MNYYNTYHKIVNQAKSRTIQPEVVEIHHVIPKSLGGDNSSENMVALTPKEHWLCHRLLCKMYTGKEKSKMVFALWRMCNRRFTKVTGRRYQYAKQQRLDLVRSKEYRKQNSNTLKQLWQTEEYRKNRAEGMRKAMADPERRKRMSRIARQKFKDNPELRKILSKKGTAENLRRWSDPAYKEKLRQAQLKRWARIRAGINQ